MPYLRAALIRKRAQDIQPPVLEPLEPEQEVTPELDDEQPYVVVSAVDEPQEAPEQEAPEIEEDKLISALLNVIDAKVESVESIESIEEINEPAGTDESVYVREDADDGSDIQEVPEEKEPEPEGSPEGITAEVPEAEKLTQPDASNAEDTEQNSQIDQALQPEIITVENADEELEEPSLAESAVPEQEEHEALQPETLADISPEVQPGEQIQPDEAASPELEQPQEEQDAITHSEDFDENSLLDDGTSELTQSQPEEFKLQYDFTSGERYVDKVSTKTEFDKMLDELSSISKDLLAWEVEKFAKQYTNKFQDSSGDYAKKYEAFLGGYITNAAMLLDDNGYRDLALKQLDQAKSILEARKRLEEERQAIIARTEEQNDTVDLSDILGLFGDG